MRTRVFPFVALLTVCLWAVPALAATVTGVVTDSSGAPVEGARVVLKLTQNAKVDPNKLLQLIQDTPQAKFSPNGVLSFPIKEQGAEVIDAIERLLRGIAA